METRGRRVEQSGWRAGGRTKIFVAPRPFRRRRRRFAGGMIVVLWGDVLHSVVAIGCGAQT